MQDFTKVIKLRIYPNEDQIALFRQMTEQYHKACNFVSQYIFDHGFNLNSRELRADLYHDVRDQFGLKSQLADSVFRTATARYKTTQTQLAQKPYKYQDETDLDEDGKPKWKYIPRTLEWLWRPVFFGRPQADLVRGRDYSFVDDGTMLSMNTLGPRVKVPYDHDTFVQYFTDKWQFGTGKLVSFRGKWFFHIPVTRKIPEFTRNNVHHVVGIDRGLRFLATVCDSNGSCEFIDGKHIMKVRDKYADVRAQLQRKGTRNAKRTLKRLSGKENRWMSDINHSIAKTLCDKYGSGTLFVLEDLVGVTFEEENLSGCAKSNRQKRSWAFYQLEQFLTYKAHEVGSEVLKVSAYLTSQRCPKCGRIRKENRYHHEHEYVCDCCGYHSNDDRSAAMNILNLGTLWMSGDENPRYGVRKAEDKPGSKKKGRKKKQVSTGNA